MEYTLLGSQICQGNPQVVVEIQHLPESTVVI